jgi:hypothetical protein
MRRFDFTISHRSTGVLTAVLSYCGDSNDRKCLYVDGSLLGPLRTSNLRHIVAFRLRFCLSGPDNVPLRMPKNRNVRSTGMLMANMLEEVGSDEWRYVNLNAISYSLLEYSWIPKVGNADLPVYSPDTRSAELKISLKHASKRGSVGSTRSRKFSPGQMSCVTFV